MHSIVVSRDGKNKDNYLPAQPGDDLSGADVSGSLHSLVNISHVEIRNTFRPREPRAVKDGISQLSVASRSFAGLRMLIRFLTETPSVNNYIISIYIIIN